MKKRMLLVAMLAACLVGCKSEKEKAKQTQSEEQQHVRQVQQTAAVNDQDYLITDYTALAEAQAQTISDASPNYSIKEAVENSALPTNTTIDAADQNVEQQQQEVSKINSDAEQVLEEDVTEPVDESSGAIIPVPDGTDQPAPLMPQQQSHRGQEIKLSANTDIESESLKKQFMNMFKVSNKEKQGASGTESAKESSQQVETQLAPPPMPTGLPPVTSEAKASASTSTETTLATTAAAVTPTPSNAGTPATAAVTPAANNIKTPATTATTTNNTAPSAEVTSTPAIVSEPAISSVATEPTSVPVSKPVTTIVKEATPPAIVTKPGVSDDNTEPASAQTMPTTIPEPAAIPSSTGNSSVSSTTPLSKVPEPLEPSLPAPLKPTTSEVVDTSAATMPTTSTETTDEDPETSSIKTDEDASSSSTDSTDEEWSPSNDDSSDPFWSLPQPVNL